MELKKKTKKITPQHLTNVELSLACSSELVPKDIFISCQLAQLACCLSSCVNCVLHDTTHIPSTFITVKSELVLFAFSYVQWMSLIFYRLRVS